MEKIEKEIIEEEHIYHTFYCDKCGKEICSSFEYEDGYYSQPDSLELQINFFSDWLYLNKGLFCVNCIEEKKRELLEDLKNIGFKKEKE